MLPLQLQILSKWRAIPRQGSTVKFFNAAFYFIRTPKQIAFDFVSFYYSASGGGRRGHVEKRNECLGWNSKSRTNPLRRRRSPVQRTRFPLNLLMLRDGSSPITSARLRPAYCATFLIHRRRLLKHSSSIFRLRHRRNCEINGSPPQVTKYVCRSMRPRK